MTKSKGKTHDGQNRQYWVRILQCLQRRLKPQSFGSWFRPTVQIDEDDTCVRILIPSKHFREVIERYRQEIEACIEEAGLPRKKLQFLTDEEIQGIVTGELEPIGTKGGAIDALRNYIRETGVLGEQELAILLERAAARGIDPERFASESLHRLERLFERAQAVARSIGSRSPTIHRRLLLAHLPADPFAVLDALLKEMPPDADSTAKALPFRWNIALFLPFVRFPALVLSRKKAITIRDSGCEYKRISAYRGMSPKSAALLDFAIDRALRIGKSVELNGEPVYVAPIWSDEICRLFGWKQARTKRVERLFESLAFTLYVRESRFQIEARLLIRGIRRIQSYSHLWCVFVSAPIVEALRRSGWARFVNADAVWAMAGMSAFGQALARWLAWHFHGLRGTVHPVEVHEDQLAWELLGIQLRTDGTRRWFRSKVRRGIREVNETGVLARLGVVEPSVAVVDIADGVCVFSRAYNHQPA